MKKRGLVIILAMGLLAFSTVPIGIFLKEKSAESGRSVAERIDRMITCLDSKDAGSNGRADLTIDQGSDIVRDLNNVQWARVECSVAAVGVPTSGTEVGNIMTAIIEASNRNEDVMVACHEVGHELGRVSWTKLQEEGLVLGLELCTYGYYHGYMREAVTSENGASRVPFLVKFCDEQAREKTGEFDLVRYDFCAHGVGHAVGSAKFPMKQSVELCENFPTDSNTSGGSAGWCVTGVYNEMFTWPWGKGKETVHDYVAICEEVKDVYKLHCGQYTVQNSRIDIEEIKKTCNEIMSEMLRNGCWQAVSQKIVRQYWFPSGRNNGIEYYRNPAEGAAIISEACRDDQTTGCAKEFAADSMSTTQSPDLVIDVCRLLDEKADARDCEWQVTAIRGSNTYVEK